MYTAVLILVAVPYSVTFSRLYWTTELDWWNCTGAGAGFHRSSKSQLIYTAVKMPDTLLLDDVIDVSPMDGNTCLNKISTQVTYGIMQLTYKLHSFILKQS